jgi:hypothetical protein
MNRLTILAAGAAAVLLTACSGSSSQPPAPVSTTPVAAPAAVHLQRSPAAAVIAGRMKAAGMPIRHLVVYTPVTDPNHLMDRQGGYTSKVAWVNPQAAKADPGDTRGSIGLGGGIEVYPTAAGAQQRRAELAAFKPPLGDGWDYVAGTAVLRLSTYLTPGQASAYLAAFRKAAG